MAEVRLLVKFTPREMQVLELVERGYCTKEIASQMKIQERTVKFHKSTLLAKLSAVNTPQMIAEAFRHGLLH